MKLRRNEYCPVTTRKIAAEENWSRSQRERANSEYGASRTLIIREGTASFAPLKRCASS